MQNCLKRNDLKMINIKEFGIDLPDLKNITESKALVIGKWLENRIKEDLAAKKINVSSLLPTKSEFAYLLGVSVGTMQNAFRYLEDINLVESKQCIGTLIKDEKSSSVRKLTSKREIAIELVKKYIFDKNIKINSALPSSRKIASALGFSANTVRLAMEYLCTQGILEHKFKNSKETGWVLSNKDFEFSSVDSNETLVNKIETDLKKYITENHKVGDKMPVHSVLAEKLGVSIKTIHDSLKILIDEGILLARRGRYGTVIIRMPNEMAVEQRRETSIFAPAKETAFYYYERTQNNIKKMIAENYQIGSKLPSINELSKQMDLSPNTIRKAI